MGELLLISDDLDRTRRLARDLGAFRACRVHDLYDDTARVGTFELIVSDVKVLNSDAVLRLRRLLGVIRQSGMAYLCLVHDEGARTRSQADLLGATGTLSASAATHLLLNALANLQEQVEPIPQQARQGANTAQRFLRETFVPGQPFTPDLIDAGTEIVADSVREVGIRAWVRAVQRFDDGTHQHCLLVAGLACAFGTMLSFGIADRHRLAKAALLHDVGKIHVPTFILNKPGKLDAAESAVMRTHPTHGHAMLVGRGFEDTMLAVVRSHHEMLDGSGYPDGLRGREIPDLVRLVTVCDIYGALIERRSYRAPMPGAKAYAVLKGMHDRLDADLVRTFHPIAAAFGSDTLQVNETIGSTTRS